MNNGQLPSAIGALLSAATALLSALDPALFTPAVDTALVSFGSAGTLLGIYLYAYFRHDSAVKGVK